MAPTTIRVLGLDVGDRRIGVALSDPLGFSAQPLTVVERTGSVEDIEVVRTLVEGHQVSIVVVGLPLTMRGEHGPQARKVTAFAQRLRQRVSVPVEFMDERLTTVQGQRAMLATDTSRRKRKQTIDVVAAQLILQQFLDVHRLEKDQAGS